LGTTSKAVVIIGRAVMLQQKVNASRKSLGEDMWKANNYVADEKVEKRLKRADDW
jgi:hypothetical protein